MSDFNIDDYMALMTELDYIEYKVGTLDPRDLAQAREIMALYERHDELTDLLNQWRAIERRKGFKLIKGGKYGG